MKKVLIITTHFAPDRHVGAKRPIKFAKFLPEFGWQPVILTKEEKCYHGIDDTLNEDLPNDVSIFRIREWHLSRSAESANIDRTNKVTSRITRKESLSVRKFIGRLLFFDFEWLLPACYNGIRIVNEQQIDVLFSTSPSPEAHLVGLLLKILTGRPWVADFRDPWTALHAFYKPGCFKRGVDGLCEKVVVATGDHITAISRTLARNLNGLRGRRKKSNVSVIYNGYDEDDFDEIDDSTLGAQPFNISYLGTWGGGRSPEPFLRAVSRLLAVHPNLKDRIRVNFVGEVKFDPEMHTRIEWVISEESLDGVVKMIPFLPYRRGLDLLRNGDISLLVVSPFHARVGCLSSKLFEYLYAGKPILALAPPESEEAQIIHAAGAGQVVAPDDITHIEEKIYEMYKRFESRDLTCNPSGVEKFDRRIQTGMLAEIFSSLVAGRTAPKADVCMV